jgi:hypothetical protein
MSKSDDAPAAKPAMVAAAKPAMKIDPKAKPKKKLTAFLGTDTFKMISFAGTLSLFMAIITVVMGVMTNSPAWFMWIMPIVIFASMFALMWWLMEKHRNGE